MISISANIQGLDKVRREMARLSGPQIKDAFSKALNDTAFEVRREMQREMQSKFDAPTPWITRSPKVFPATADNLNASIAPTYRSDVGSTGGKSGVDPQQVLQAQEFGGRRANKRSENALDRAGILPAGYQTAIPGEEWGGPFPGSTDTYGNLRGAFVQQLLSYLQAYSEQGYKANMKPQGMRNMHAYGRAGISKAAQQQAGPRLGRRYFVAYGRLRGGTRTTSKGDVDTRAHNLPPGIWATVDRTGADVRPVLLFVKAGKYTPRISMQSIKDRVTASEYLQRRMRYRILKAAGK